MNPDFRPAEFDAANPGGQGGCEQHEEPLALFDPASPSELPPEHFDAWLDRLVDGELAEPQRRALLARLEHRPDGWRRCALAFLEAQAWHDALGPSSLGCDLRIEVAAPAPARSRAMGSASSASAPPERPSHKAAHKAAWYRGPLLGMVAAAASFVLAFALGLAVQKAWLSPSDNAASMVVDTASPGAPIDRAVVDTKSPQWGTVQFVVDGPSGTPQQVRWPAVDGPDAAQWLRQQPPAIPEEIVQELRRHGHHVQTQRRYVPIPLDDGRSAVFPLDHVDVRFRGGNGYQ
jgi:hypothetical protein